LVSKSLPGWGGNAFVCVKLPFDAREPSAQPEKVEPACGNLLLWAALERNAFYATLENSPKGPFLPALPRLFRLRFPIMIAIPGGMLSNMRETEEKRAGILPGELSVHGLGDGQNAFAITPNM
jgi:hypothetical protein